MCGRLNITDNEGIRLLMELVGMPSWPTIQARYNVAPTALLDTLAKDPHSNTDISHVSANWGLIPVWAKPGQFSSPLINARAETVWEKPSFKNLIKRQRACIPINGFYEWNRSAKQKIPHYIFPAQDQAMFIAGIFQKSAESRIDLSLLTTQANAAMAPIHHRMPVIIPADGVKEWLCNDDATVLNDLMFATNDGVLASREVSSYVNNARNEGPECIAAIK